MLFGNWENGKFDFSKPKSWRQQRLFSLLFLFLIHLTKSILYFKIHLFLKKNQMKYSNEKKQEKSRIQKKVTNLENKKKEYFLV